MAIEFQHVTKRFGAVTAVDDVSVTFGGDRIYGLLGNNGAGKSTLLNILTGRMCPDGGTVTVDGAPVTGDAALGKLFLVGEQNLYPDDMRVKGAFDAAALFYPDFDRNRAEDLAEQFGLSTKQKISRLSTGYGSIFRLILGLCVNTPYVLFDEPVLGLDAQHRDLFYRRLLESYAEEPRTIVLSTHLIDEVADIVEYTVILRAGRVIQDAPTEELTAGACTISGPAAAVDDYAAGKEILTERSLGGLKTVSLRHDDGGTLPAGLERTRLGLQEYFISLMEEEDRK